MPAAALALLLCGVAILELVERQTGRPGLLVGLGLAVLPVPLVLGALAWLDRVEPTPVRALVFCFGWGACAATLVAILANTWTADLLASHRGARGETIGSAVAAPLVEETCKGAAVLLLFLLRRRYVGSVAGGIVLAGVTACGFAFTENVLYLGRSWTEDRAAGHGIDATVCTFVLRGVLSPFAHPLFTALIGIGFATAALARGRLLRTAAPAGGWLAATVLHGTWNAAAALGTGGFLLVYGVFMVPVFGGVIGLAVRARGAGLRAARLQLPAYVRAGWLGEDEPEALGTVRLRGRARRRARALHGPAGARAVDEYVALATALALLRRRAERGAVPVAEFAVREYGLLQRLWRLRPLASPALAEAAAEQRADGG
ncbi:PrsW family intramembrane metalloprotease [Streptacidiphilus sp. ASG 303]|uniref:PrsW family intramembrane metalloprotease n=1 Tax=Streptacidiphilus sp. ASG 303 TaxID=2896847 RepID=UPI001E3F3C9C|nr:PrsW family intramembrane metalloprotease [Streptacidiphilus sp. ASG 303]